VRVTEWEEPQAVVGSYLHRYAYPDWYAEHEKRRPRLRRPHNHRHGGPSCVSCAANTVYVAEGSRGMRVYDVASIANKGVSQRIITAPFSPLGHDTHSRPRTRPAWCCRPPAGAPERNKGDLMRKVNQEQPFHPIYNYAFITDSREGLILTDVEHAGGRRAAQQLPEARGDLERGGVLEGARHLTIAGHWFYIAADAGIVVVDMNDPLKPRLAHRRDPARRARFSQLQFRYLFVTTTRPASRRRDRARQGPARGRRHCPARATRASSTSPAPTPTSRPAPRAWSSSTSPSPSPAPRPALEVHGRRQAQRRETWWWARPTPRCSPTSPTA
jgi:hypothetical protein